MNKSEFINKMHAVNATEEVKVQTERACNAFIDTLTEALEAGEAVTFAGFGTFKVVSRAARQGRNPRTGAAVKIPARKTVKFTPGKSLKEAVK